MGHPPLGKDIMAGTDAKKWAAVKARIESTTDAKGRPNTFHMMEGSEGPNAANLANWKKAINTPDAHVTGMLHTGFDDSGKKGILLSDGMSFGQNGSQTVNVDPNSPNLFTISGADPVSASSISLFGCDTYGLEFQYAGLDFTGVQGTIDMSTAEAMGLASVDAMGDQSGADAANAAIDNSQSDMDTGSNVVHDPPK
jgi:hypothetical protein